MFFTILSGVTVFVIGQLFIELFLKPLQRYKSLKAKLSYIIVKHYHKITHVTSNQNFYYNNDPTVKRSNDECLESKSDLVEIAAELEGFLCEKWTFINGIFARPKKIEEVVMLLLLIQKRVIAGKQDTKELSKANKLDVEKIIKIMKLMKQPEKLSDLYE